MLHPSFHRYFFTVIVSLISMIFIHASAKAQCYSDLYIYQTNPYGALCSPQYATLRAEYSGPSTYGEFRWYVSETDPSPIQTTIMNYGDYPSSDYGVYASNGTTVWLSFLDYDTYCESDRQSYTFTFSSPAILFQDYARKCADENPKVQFSSNVSGVTFELYKLVEEYDPYYGIIQSYQIVQGNSTGYFEIYNFDVAVDQNNYFGKIYQPYGCSTPSYYPINMEVTGASPHTVNGNLSINVGTGTTLTVSGDAYNYKWYSPSGSFLQDGYQYVVPTTLTPDNYPFKVVGVNSDESCITPPVIATVMVNPPGITYATLYDNSNFSRAIDQSKPVGTVSGSAGTTATGGITYNVPIYAPPGSNGLQPSISVSYNSQAGNGVLGYGWNISSLSVITRSGKNMYNDGIVTPVSFTNSDGFLIDGIRFYPISGTNGGNETIYAAEAENFSKIISYTSISVNNPDWFKIIEKNGTVKEYGKTSDSRFLSDDGSNIVLWRLNKISDINGNYIEYIYINGFRDSRIDEIRYTGNVNTSLEPYNKIKFNYSVRTDVNTVFEAGASLSTKHLLDNITITHNSESVKIYHFKYGFDNIHSKLNEIIEKGSDNTTALNSTIFLYGDAPQNLAVSETIALQGDYDYYSGDFNADGKTDLLAAHNYLDQNINSRLHDGYSVIENVDQDSYTLLYSKNLPQNGASIKIQDKKTFNFLTSDYDGDGRDDILQVNSSTTENFLCNGGYRRKVSDVIINYTKSHNSQTGYTDYVQQSIPSPVDWLSHQYQYTSTQGNFFMPGDFDGDGNQDYILVLGAKTQDGLCAFVLPNYIFDYKAFITCPSLGEHNEEVINFGFGTNTGFNYASTVAEADMINTLDFDGDGITELLVTKNYQTYVLSIKRVPATTGYAFGCSILLTTGEITKDSKYFPGDFNGDRKTDLLVRAGNGTWKILYSNGISFVSSSFTFNQNPNIPGNSSDDKVVVSDFNGDGSSDILHGFAANASTSKFSLYFSRGGIAASFYYEQYDYANRLTIGPLTVGDFNGDGRSDLLNRMNIYLPADFISFKEFGKETLLTKVTDGHNVTTAFDYKLLTDKTIYPYFYNRTILLDDLSNKNPINYVQLPMYALSSLTLPNGIGGSNVTTFEYENAIMHRSSKGLLGFSKLTSTNTSTGITTIVENEINTQFAVPFTIKKTLSLTPTLEVLSETIISTSFENLSSGSNKRFFQHLDKILNVDHLTGSANEISSLYDNYGNITTSTSNIGALSGSAVDPVETTITTSSYGIHNTPVPAYPDNTTVSKVRSGMPTQNYTTQFTYTSNGLIASKADFYGLPKSLITTYTYTTYGNPATVTLSTSGLNSRTTSFVYDSKERVVLTKQQTGSGLSQEESYTYDYKWGKRLTQTSTDCLTTIFEYDLFGKMKRTTLPAGYSVTTNYNWDIQGENTYYILTDFPGGNPDSKIWFDKLGREIKKQQAGFNNQWLTQLITYSSKGNIDTKTNLYYSGFESPVVTTNTYDVYNRLQASANQIGTIDYTYTKLSNGRIQLVISAGGQSTTKITDASGKIITAIDNGGQLDFIYDSRGNQTEAKHGNTILLINNYDDYGRQTSLTDKNAGTVSYQYDAFGQLKSQTDQSGNTSTMTYDDFGRIVSREDLEGITTYEYYKDINTGCSNNNLSRITDFNGVVKDYIYNGLKRLITETVTIDGTTNTTQYDYDIYGHRNKVTYPSGVVIDNLYDNSGNLTVVSGGDGTSSSTLFSGISMNGFGQYNSYTLGNNLTSQNTYTYGYATRYSTPGIQDLNFNFDYLKGSLLSRQDGIKNITETFQYDALNRLTQSSVNSLVQLNLNYDGNSSFSKGNITSKTDAGEYIYKNDKIHAVAYITNPAGPLVPPTNIANSLQQITYTSFLQPSVISEGSYQMNFVYGDNYQRVKSITQQNNVIIETKYYFGNYEKQILNGQTREIHYVSGGNGLCAIIVRENGANNFYFTYTDYLGSLLSLTDINGIVIAEQNFDAWGRSRNPSTWNYPSVPSNPLWLYRGYTGHEHLAQFALINMNGRLYDPVQGRMISPDNNVPDPFNTQGYNRYAYAMNNPLLYSDPDGEFVHLIVGAVIGGLFNLMSADMSGKIGSFGDALKYFGIGAAAGALGAGVGAGISSSWVGGSFGAGFMGTTGATATGFLAGAAAGGGAGLAGGFITGFGNNLISGKSFGNSLTSGFRSSIIGAIGGGLIGGTIGGLDAMSNKTNFFTGKATVNLSGGVGAHNVGSDAMNNAVSVKYVGRFEKIAVYESSALGAGSGSGGVTLPGLGIIVGSGAYTQMSANGTWNLLAHEFGHILQSKLPYVGADGFLAIIGSESLASATFNPGSHNQFWTETWANHLSNSYFTSMPWDMINWPIQNISWFHSLKFSLWRNMHPSPVPAIYP